jgi:hypothetical protein
MKNTIDIAGRATASLACAALLCGLALTGSAGAATTHPLLGSFGPEGTAAPQFEPRFNVPFGAIAGTGPQHLAFDQAAGRVYVLVQRGNKASARIDAACRFERFDPGMLEAAPSPFAAIGDNCIGGFDLGAVGDGYEWTGVAVDNSSQPSAGSFYVTDRMTVDPPVQASVYGFDGRDDGAGPGDGAPLPTSPIAVSGSQELFLIRAAAVDSKGCVWVPEELDRKIVAFDPGPGPECPSPPAPIDTSAQGKPKRLVFDAQDNLYLNIEDGFGPEIWRYAAPTYTSAALVTPPGATDRVVALALDRTKNRLFVAYDEVAVEYDLDGVPGTLPAAEVSSFGTGLVDGGSQNGFKGIAVDEAEETIYLSNASKTRLIHVFGTETDEPIVKTLPASEVTATGALGSGTVDPQGFELTDCHFEAAPKGDQLGGPGTLQFPCASEWSEVIDEEECGGTETLRSDPGEIPTGGGPRCVTAQMAGLSPGTEYRYRLSASSEEGTGLGSTVEFTTAGPKVFGARVTGVAYGEASLSATIDPQGASTSYRFQYGTEGPCSDPENACTETEEIELPAPDGEQPATALLKGLAEGTEYHFRAIASYTGEPAVIGTSPDLAFTTYLRPSPPPGTCPNEAQRHGPSLLLPECRAYEQVSPVSKGSADAAEAKGQAAAAGAALAYRTQEAQTFPGCEGAVKTSPFVARLTEPGAGLWGSACLTTGLSPSQFDDYDFSYYAFSEDLARMAFCSNASLGTPGTGEGLFARDTRSGEVAWAPGSGRESCEGTVTAPGIFTGTGLIAAPDLEPILYRSPELLPVSSGPAPSGPGPFLYEWEPASGEQRLTSVSEGGTPVSGAIFDYRDRAISDDGQRVFWSCGAGGSQSVCARTGGATTTDIGASERGEPDPAGPLPKAFVDASADGEVAFFVSGEKLTEDSTATDQAITFSPADGLARSGELYRYDFAAPEGERLTDVTVAPGEAKGAEVQGVIDASADGSRIYFVALGKLAPEAASGQPNLYLWDRNGGSPTTTHIATLASSPVDRGNLEAYHSTATPMANPSGERLIFRSVATLQPGYDNANRAMLYLYDAGEEALHCLPCDPSGEVATANASLGSGGSPQTPLAGLLGHQRRNLSADGRRVFFQTADALTPTDTNGQVDVYLWLDEEGNGEGALHLISSGHSVAPSRFVDASASGDDVFFTTREQLSALDADSQTDVYDARVNGIAARGAPSPPDCQGEACQAAAIVPTAPTPASSSFRGDGNSTQTDKPPKRCPKGKRRVRRGGKARCARKSERQRKRDNRAGNGRRAAR